MFTAHVSIDQIIRTHIPDYTIRKVDGTEVIYFNANDVLFHQHAIVAFWKACNYYHLQPVAKTFLGRIRAIKFQ